MKKMLIEKSEAKKICDFLISLELRNRVSRLRNKLIKELEGISNSFEEDRIALCKEYSKKDEENNPIIDGETYVIDDVTSFNDELVTLQKEVVAIDIDEYDSNYEPLFTYLESSDFDVTLSYERALLYDKLLTTWENAVSNKNTEVQ